MWPIVSYILQTADGNKTPPNRSDACHIGGQGNEKDKPPTYQVCTEKYSCSGIKSISQNSNINCVYGYIDYTITFDLCMYVCSRSIPDQLQT